MSDSIWMSKLGHAIALANRWHDGQVDKLGVPYIFHPLRVMEAVREAGAPREVQIVAVLHDVLEDTDCTERQIIDIFGQRISDLVVLLSRPHGMDYQLFVRRAKSSPITYAVKLADVRDNLGRLVPEMQDYERLSRKYRRALITLQNGDIHVQ